MDPISQLKNVYAIPNVGLPALTTPMQAMLAQKPEEYHAQVDKMIENVIDSFAEVDFATKDDEIVLAVMIALLHMKMNYYTRFFFQVQCNAGVLKVHLKDSLNRLLPEHQLIERTLNKSDDLFSEIEPDQVVKKPYNPNHRRKVAEDKTIVRLRKLAYLESGATTFCSAIWGTSIGAARQFIEANAKFMKKTKNDHPHNLENIISLTEEGWATVKQHGGPIECSIENALQLLAKDDLYKQLVHLFFVENVDSFDIPKAHRLTMQAVAAGNIFRYNDGTITLTSDGNRFRELCRR